MNLQGRNLLKETDLSADEFLYLVDLGGQLRLQKRMGLRNNRLAGRNIALIFEKTSTRTRSAFEVAAHDEGAHVTYLGPEDSQLGRKESVKDTARVLGRMFDGIEYRGAAQETVETLGAWAGVKDKIAQAENVRAALLLVARGEAPLGIVYSTDAAAEPNVKIVGAFPADSHPPIIYPAAETRDSKSADARLFLDYLKSTKARPALEKQGFTVLVKSASST